MTGPSSSQFDTAATTYRPDIDGLRAIAVLFVVFFHSFPRYLAPGGFIGVDIFFVISGFLITRIILNDLRARQFSFLDFYARRARRLFPALVVVLAATWAMGAYVMLPDEFVALGRHIMAGAGFVSNILTNFEIGYFDLPAQTKPLLHLWSLGVEEQFYLFFPAVLFLASYNPRLTAPLLIVLSVLSFAANIGTVREYPSFAFYSPVTRLWEFGFGAILAYRALSRPGGQLLFDHKKWNEIAAAVGLVLIFIAVARARANGFPGWRAITPVLGAFLLIGAGPATWVSQNILSHRYLVFIGLISYPLYLWHWPLIVFGRIEFGHDPQTMLVAAIALSFVLAAGTYQFIERPVRAWRPSRWRITAGWSAALCLIAALGLWTIKDGFLIRIPEQIQTLLVPRQYADDYIPWTNNADRPGPLVVTWGDSHADHILQGLFRLQHERPFRVVWARWWDGCPPDNEGRQDWERCPGPGPEVMKRITGLKPDTVIVANYWRQYPDHIKRLRDTLTFLQSINVRNIVVLGPAPYWPKFATRMIYEAYAASGRQTMPERLSGNNQQDVAIDADISEVAALFGVRFVSLRKLLCHGADCLVIVDGAPVQSDQSHFTALGSWYVVNNIQKKIFD